MKKYAPWVAAVVILIVVVAALLIPQLTNQDDAVVTPATATPVADVSTQEPTSAPEATQAPETEPTDEPADTSALSDAAQTQSPAPETVLATLNGQDVTYQDVDDVAQTLMYSYSQYGYDFSDPTMQETLYQLAMEYAIQLNMMEQKAAELGFDQLSDEERTALEADVDASWESLVDQYVLYYGGLTEDATDEDEAAARVSAIAGLESMGYTKSAMLDSAVESAMFDKVEAEMVKGAQVTDQEITDAFNEHAKADEASYAQDVATYEYMTNYYGQTSYYQPEGYRGITHILLEVDEELLTNYQTLVAKLEEQQEAAEATAEPEATADTTAQPEVTADTAAQPEVTAEPEEPVTQEQVDAAYQAILDAVAPTIAEINAKLAEGVAFADLIAEYGTDPGMTQEPYKSEGYPVHMDSILWDPAFVQAAFSVDEVGEVAEPVVGSYGVHIVQYTRDVPAGPIALTDEIKSALREELLATKESELFNSTMAAWLADSELTYTAEGAAYEMPDQTDTAE